MCCMKQRLANITNDLALSLNKIFTTSYQLMHLAIVLLGLVILWMNFFLSS